MAYGSGDMVIDVNDSHVDEGQRAELADSLIRQYVSVRRVGSS